MDCNLTANSILPGCRPSQRAEEFRSCKAPAKIYSVHRSGLRFHQPENSRGQLLQLGPILNRFRCQSLSCVSVMCQSIASERETVV